MIFDAGYLEIQKAAKHWLQLDFKYDEEDVRSRIPYLRKDSDVVQVSDKASFTLGFSLANLSKARLSSGSESTALPPLGDDGTPTPDGDPEDTGVPDPDGGPATPVLEGRMDIDVKVDKPVYWVDNAAWKSAAGLSVDDSDDEVSRHLPTVEGLQMQPLEDFIRVSLSCI